MMIVSNTTGRVFLYEDLCDLVFDREDLRSTDRVTLLQLVDGVESEISAGADEFGTLEFLILRRLTEELSRRDQLNQ